MTGHSYATMHHDLDGLKIISLSLSLSFSLLFALRYPRQDCLQCLGIKSLMRECQKSKYKNTRSLAPVPFNRRQSAYGVAVVTQEDCHGPPTFWANREIPKSSIGAGRLNVSWLLALVADALRRWFRRAVAAQMALLTTCCCPSELEDASNSGFDIQL